MPFAKNLPFGKCVGIGMKRKFYPFDKTARYIVRMLKGNEASKTFLLYILCNIKR